MIPAVFPGFSYIYGNRVLSCSFALPSLKPAPTDAPPPTLHVEATSVTDVLPDRHDWLHHWADGRGNIAIRLAAQRDGYLLRFPGLCDFRLDPAHGIVHPCRLHATSAETLEHLLIDQVLPRLLADLGELVVHAGCVRMRDACVLFLGRSGWGKSTLVSLLRQHGHGMLSDDCAIVSSSDAGITAISTYPSLRLFDDSIVHARIDARTLSPVACYTGKRRIALDAADSAEAVRIAALYLLNDPIQQHTTTITITPLPPATACMALIEHGFRLDLGAAGPTVAFMQQAAHVADNTPAFHLAYPRDYTGGGQLVSRLAQHLASLG